MTDNMTSASTTIEEALQAMSQQGTTLQILLKNNEVREAFIKAALAMQALAQDTPSAAIQGEKVTGFDTALTNLCSEINTLAQKGKVTALPKATLFFLLATAVDEVENRKPPHAPAGGPR